MRPPGAWGRACNRATWGRRTEGWLDAASIYEKHPDTVLNNWRNWWQQKGQAKYPSVESMLTKAQRFRTERPWAREAQPDH